MAEPLILTDDELRALTGYAQPARQLGALHAMGYFRARRSPRTGNVILERAHYDAVARGQVAPAPAGQRPRPRLRLASA